jgi:hypothetical protein
MQFKRKRQHKPQASAEPAVIHSARTRGIARFHKLDTRAREQLEMSQKGHPEADKSESSRSKDPSEIYGHKKSNTPAGDIAEEERSHVAEWPFHIPSQFIVSLLPSPVAVRSPAGPG